MAKGNKHKATLATVNLTFGGGGGGAADRTLPVLRSVKGGDPTSAEQEAARRAQALSASTLDRFAGCPAGDSLARVRVAEEISRMRQRERVTAQERMRLLWAAHNIDTPRAAQQLAEESALRESENESFLTGAPAALSPLSPAQQRRRAVEEARRVKQRMLRRAHSFSGADAGGRAHGPRRSASFRAPTAHTVDLECPRAIPTVAKLRCTEANTPQDDLSCSPLSTETWMGRTIDWGVDERIALSPVSWTNSETLSPKVSKNALVHPLSQLGSRNSAVVLPITDAQVVNCYSRNKREVENDINLLSMSDSNWDFDSVSYPNGRCVEVEEPADFIEIRLPERQSALIHLSLDVYNIAPTKVPEKPVEECCDEETERIEVADQVASFLAEMLSSDEDEGGAEREREGASCRAGRQIAVSNGHLPLDSALFRPNALHLQPPRCAVQDHTSVANEAAVCSGETSTRPAVPPLALPVPSLSQFDNRSSRMLPNSGMPFLSPVHSVRPSRGVVGTVQELKNLKFYNGTFAEFELHHCGHGGCGDCSSRSGVTYNFEDIGIIKNSRGGPISLSSGSGIATAQSGRADTVRSHETGVSSAAQPLQVGMPSPGSAAPSNAFKSQRCRAWAENVLGNFVEMSIVVSSAKDLNRVSWNDGLSLLSHTKKAPSCLDTSLELASLLGDAVADMTAAVTLCDVQSGEISLQRRKALASALRVGELLGMFLSDNLSGVKA